MSPRKKKRKKYSNAAITLDPVEVYGSKEPAEYNIDPNHAEVLQNHIKDKVGGSMVSVCL